MAPILLMVNKLLGIGLGERETPMLVEEATMKEDLLKESLLTKESSLSLSRAIWDSLQIASRHPLVGQMAGC